MDFTKPIDITAVNEAKVKYGNLLQSVLFMSAASMLKHCTAVPGITSALKVGMASKGSILKKYKGVFKGNSNFGAIAPRLLEVWPIVAEMMDEPERYRKTYIAEVPGDIRAKHPFELWLLQRGINQASEDLFKVLMTAERSNQSDDTGVEHAFNGWGTIVEAEKTTNKISVAAGNMFSTGAFTKTDVGSQLLEMYRSRPETFRSMKNNIKLFVSEDVADMYDDWRIARGHVIIGQTEEVNSTKLLGSNGRCEIVRLGNLPSNSQFAMLTTKENMLYGFDKESDMTNMIPFFKDPYLFTAVMKFVFGCEFNSIDGSEFCVNDQLLKPAAAQEPNE